MPDTTDPTDETPPNDFPDEGDYAVIRSYGLVRKWGGRVWAWRGRAGWEDISPRPWSILNALGVPSPTRSED